MKQAFFPHLIDGKLFVSEKIVHGSGASKFRVVLKMEESKVAHCYRESLTRSELNICTSLVHRFAAITKSKKLLLDPYQLIHGLPEMADLQSLSIIKLLSEYTVALSIYTSAVQQYKTTLPKDRMQPEYALDLYRMALGFHDLKTAIVLLEEDQASEKFNELNRLHSAGFRDLFYHVLTRAGRRKDAFEHLKKAWTSEQDKGRSKILVNEAAFFGESREVIRHAKYLNRFGPLEPRVLAILAVSQIRLGQTEAAEKSLATLQSLEGNESQKMVRNVKRFKKTFVS